MCRPSLTVLAWQFFPWNNFDTNFMSSIQSNRLIEVLKATLLHVETSTEWNQDDYAVVELKRILQRRIDQELSLLDPDQT